jgi:predicted HD phosphohydrolase
LSTDGSSRTFAARKEDAMETVSFVNMADGKKEDYDLLGVYEEKFAEELPDRLLAALERLKDSFPGYKVSRYEHSLQGATRALRDGRDEEYVVATLLHDIGDDLAPYTHSEAVSAILKPFIRPELIWIIGHHGAFQMYYYGHFKGLDRNVRDRWAGHEYYEGCREFCEQYDQNCFDPDYDTLPIEEFEPMVRRVCSEPRYLPEGYA